jgi:hypothetical protein
MKDYYGSVRVSYGCCVFMVICFSRVPMSSGETMPSRSIEAISFDRFPVAKIGILWLILPLVFLFSGKTRYLLTHFQVVAVLTYTRQKKSNLY